MIREQRVESAIMKVHDAIVGKCKKCDNGFIASEVGQDIQSMVHVTSRKCDCFRMYETAKSYIISGIPQEFWGMRDQKITVDPKSTEKIDTYLKKFDAIYDNGIGLLFLGSEQGLAIPNNGVGKTAIATKVIEHALAHGKTAHYITMHSYFNLIYRSKEDSEFLALCDEIEDVDFLCIDEVGKINETDYVRNKFENMIRNRSGQLKVNILITNMNTQELTSMFGYSIMDILTNQCVDIRLTGASFRQAKFVDIKKKLQWGLS